MDASVDDHGRRPSRLQVRKPRYRDDARQELGKFAKRDSKTGARSSLSLNNRLASKKVSLVRSSLGSLGDPKQLPSPV